MKILNRAIKNHTKCTVNLYLSGLMNDGILWYFIYIVVVTGIVGYHIEYVNYIDTRLKNILLLNFGSQQAKTFS